ncbi:MAG TPA: TetM/TetW/TetO/TetS family tetracycline resistance ribosomal protection protein [Candidatus Copromorpha excrementipullorum]|uniref:TetM/TetW/TetO/TetS family tetracycline resistance ribosomal protection protein n=1 Tax=Candidatus Allocopromorpha excrementipullorum TaxID=2840743 RepID=A0A9D1STQ5_9FIRM|nr:TetM/TetW/TetO/TetS family tetracycline resistance ribosomal protection protein [Candidatus Copromorpha excrementipullorum]
MGKGPENNENNGKRKAARPPKHICIGLVAHVDAGKTTLSEALLYRTGTIRKWGRVDHGDAFLDTDRQEKERGITIFSKEAELKYGITVFTLLDTPGHVDFSAEMERTLQVLDYAVLVINGREGVQGHTATLWKLAEKYGIPLFIFINKTDLEGVKRDDVMDELRERLDQRCITFDVDHDGEWLEQAAMCDEALLEELLDTGTIEDDSLRGAIAERKIFPCYFGSALKLEGIDGLLEGLSGYSTEKQYGSDFGVRIYKISRDEKGARLTHMKITGGTLRVKDEIGREKVEQIRIYSGGKFRSVDEAKSGDVCAVTGLKTTYAGQGLGAERDAGEPVLESVLTYKVELPGGVDAHRALEMLKLLEEEDPQLKVVWNGQLQEIHMQLMGQVQIEILRNIIADRFGFDVEFGQGAIAYKETIAAPVFGAGHFEPLRHYAEVHLLLEPAPRGSGLTLDTRCSEDVLDRNWQRLILTHLAEREHPGALTGSPITDMKITLLAGRSHLKHTEGGDFRQATYRALRQGLRKAESILLEPWYEFRLEVPQGSAGRAMGDIQRMNGALEEPETAGENVVLSGRAPVSEMKDYGIEVASYTKGYGHLSCSLWGYEQCHRQEEVVEEIGYDIDGDVENTADSVFCTHGAGVVVKWDEADEMMHMQGTWGMGSTEMESRDPESRKGLRTADGLARSSAEGRNAGHSESTGKTGSTKKKDLTEEEELERIFEMTYGKRKERRIIPKREISHSENKTKIKPSVVKEEYLLVDGYNIIFAWDDLKALAKINMDSARQALIEILENYQGYRKCHVIAVFDAYRVKGGERRQEKHGSVDVVYTREAETADMYIEKTAHAKSRDFHVRVATSDRLEQLIITGSGAFKVSADEFRAEVQQADTEISKLIEAHNLRNRQQGGSRIVIPGKSE